MNRDQAFAMIEQAKVRELTEQEADELGAWAKSTLVEPASLADVLSHPLFAWASEYSKFMRDVEKQPCAYFLPNFKLIQSKVMPHVVSASKPLLRAK